MEKSAMNPFCELLRIPSGYKSMISFSFHPLKRMEEEIICNRCTFHSQDSFHQSKLSGSLSITCLIQRLMTGDRVAVEGVVERERYESI